MRFRPPLRVSVTRHGEKEQKLREFVLHHIGHGQEGSAAAAPGAQLLIVARSMESPVVKAIAGLRGEITTAGLSVRLILAQLDPDALPAAWNRSVGIDHEIRWAKHPRLIEAHEQLVVGPATCWIGDCMRRDPAKCDAFENYVEDCGEAAGCAAVSFERLWFASEPVAQRRLPGASTTPDPIPTLDAASQASAGTRH